MLARFPVVGDLVTQSDCTHFSFKSKNVSDKNISKVYNLKYPVSNTLNLYFLNLYVFQRVFEVSLLPLSLKRIVLMIQTYRKIYKLMTKIN